MIKTRIKKLKPKKEIRRLPMGVNMKRKKRRSRYSMVIVSHNPEKQDKQLYLSSWYFRLLSILVILGLTAGLVFFSVNMIMNGTILQGNKKNLEDLQEKVNQLTEENSTLLTENTDLLDKNSILITTVNEKLAQEEEFNAKKIPSGFPILGTTSIVEDPSTVVIDPAAQTAYVPIVIFQAAKDVSIISSAYGTVTEVAEDPEYGYRVVLDHGNGYVSIYRFKQKPKVRVNDEITRGTMLGETTEESERVGYQIMIDSQYMNPMEIMEIYG